MVSHLLGDTKYGPRKTMDIGGQALHAGVIGFEHPITKEYIEQEAPLPQYFNEILTELEEVES